MKEKNPEVIDFGSFLKGLRERAKLSLGDVARAIGWNKQGQFLSNIESNRSSLPIQHIPKLAKLYKVDSLVIRKAAAEREIALIKKKYGLERNTENEESRRKSRA